MTKALRTTLAAAALAALATGGCSTSAPERPAYDVPDQVGGDVDPAALVGVWQVTPLNPYPEQGEQETLIEYRDDGSVVGQVDPSDDEAMAALGDVRFEMTGRWSVSEGSVTHRDVKMEALSDNTFAKLMTSLVNGAKRDLGGTADIRELGPDRIVMLGTDGAAMRYDRVR